MCSLPLLLRRDRYKQAWHTKNKQECQACLKISTSYGSRTRDLRLERAASLATRRTRLVYHSLDCTLMLVLCQEKIAELLLFIFIWLLQRFHCLRCTPLGRVYP